MSLSFKDIPIPASPFGERMYARGRELVEVAGVRLDQLVWDADEVLWDWLLHAGRIAARGYRWLYSINLSHREWASVKPGIFEMLWGMHHASRDAGQDPHMRIWTSGYAWRLWRYAQHIPGFAELLGPPATPEDPGHEGFRDHPRIFWRHDYVQVARSLLDPEVRAEAIAGFPEASRDVIEGVFADDPFDPGFKLPELAVLRGKPGFAHSRVLIDDTAENVERFVASGRQGLHLRSEPARIFGRVKNVVWARPMRKLARMATAVAEDIANALKDLFVEGGEAIRSVGSVEPPPEEHHRIAFALDVPSSIVRSEWFDPIRQLRKQHGKGLALEADPVRSTD